MPQHLNASQVIYGDAPLIEDMGVLTTLCLLHDEVLLFGNKPLAEHLEDHRRKEGPLTEAIETLIAERLVAFLSPTDVAARFPGAGDIELPGIDGFEETKVDGKLALVAKVNDHELNDFSR